MYPRTLTRSHTYTHSLSPSAFLSNSFQFFARFLLEVVELSLSLSLSLRSIHFLTLCKGSYIHISHPTTRTPSPFIVQPRTLYQPPPPPRFYHFTHTSHQAVRPFARRSHSFQFCNPVKLRKENKTKYVFDGYDFAYWCGCVSANILREYCICIEKRGLANIFIYHTDFSTTKKKQKT